MGVLLERHGDVGVVTLDWPEDRNSLDHARIREVVDVLADAVRSTGTVVLTGNGSFCSGGNLGSVASTTVLSAADHRDRIATHAQLLVRTIVDAPVPILAAVDGPAVGLGFDVALACDERLIGPAGWLMQGWGRLGLLPGAGGQLFLRRLNPSIVWRLLAEQPRITGVEAKRWGLGEAVDEPAVDAAVRRAEALCAVPRDVLELYVSMNRADVRRELPEHLALCAREQGRLLADPALADRVAALRARSR